MTEINKEIEEMAEIIAIAMVGDVADNEDIRIVTPIATKLHNAGYRQEKEVVKQFAEKLKKELFAKCVVLSTIYNPHEQDMDSAEAFTIIDQLAAEYEVAVSKTELTTAEMLLWLVGKSNEGVFSIIQARDVIMLNFVIGKNHNFVIGKNHINAREETLDKAIKQAYDWAKQEEQNAKN